MDPRSALWWCKTWVTDSTDKMTTRVEKTSEDYASRRRDTFLVEGGRRGCLLLRCRVLTSRMLCSKIVVQLVQMTILVVTSAILAYSAASYFSSQHRISRFLSSFSYSPSTLGAYTKSIEYPGLCNGLLTSFDFGLPFCFRPSL